MTFILKGTDHQSCNENTFFKIGFYLYGQKFFFSNKKRIGLVSDDRRIEACRVRGAQQ